MDLKREAFRNRLRKMSRHYDRWARRQGLEAYRIYDADLDEFPLTVDRYGDRLSIAVYEREEDFAEEECRADITAALGVDPGSLYFRRRRRQKGARQYEKVSADGAEFAVGENGRTFLVNLEDYLDTGLFLDHRNTRKQIGERSRGKRVLNLFAYTCSFGVYAATGGASHVDNVDLSNTYLDWGRRNFSANGLDPATSGFLKADALAWLRETPTEAYDLIVLDPPTFSNSKMMADVLDTQRDHAELIDRCLARLTPDGELYFSTNYRRFKLDTAAFRGQAREITGQTIPKDFRRKNLHRCWVVTHGLP